MAAIATAMSATLTSVPHPSSSPYCFSLRHTNLISSSSYSSITSALSPRRRPRNQSLSSRAAAHGGSRSRATLSDGWELSGMLASPLASGSASVVSSLPKSLPNLEDLDTTNMLLRQRIVFLGSLVDAMTADFIINQLLLLDAEDHARDINLFINSPGGEVTSAMGIYDAMKLCKADISTICFGLAASTGAFILAAGTKGKRFCMPNAKVMIHQSLGNLGGSATDIALQLKETIYHRQKMNKILSRITGKSEEQINEDTQYDNFMSPWEAKDYGLVDAVIDDGKPGLVAPAVDASPPPKVMVSGLWRVSEDGRKAEEEQPSEEKLHQNGYNMSR